MTDPFDLNRFEQAHASTFGRALNELREGRKRSHWMWYIFPQLDGLGSSPTARRYAIRSRNEAVAYWEHPQLGKRLADAVRATLSHAHEDPRDLFGYPDDLKFRSCLTLFATCVPSEPLFKAALDAFYAGEPDSRTLDLLERQDPPSVPAS